jgi:hypothetical protein
MLQVSTSAAEKPTTTAGRDMKVASHYALGGVHVLVPGKLLHLPAPG